MDYYISIVRYPILPPFLFLPFPFFSTVLETGNISVTVLLMICEGNKINIRGMRLEFDFIQQEVISISFLLINAFKHYSFLKERKQECKRLKEG